MRHVCVPLRHGSKSAIARSTMLVVAAALAASLLGPLVVEARPHAPPPKWKNPMGEPGEPDQWLERLKGRYRVDGFVEVAVNHPDYEDLRCAPPPPRGGDSLPPRPLCEKISGMVDCVAVGDGSGVQCILSAKWNDLYEIWLEEPPSGGPGGVWEVPGGAGNPSPSMALFGLEPYGKGMRFMLVDAKGLAEGAPGGVRGDRTSFRTPCVNTPTLLGKMRLERLDSRPLQTCERSIRIDARIGGKVVNLSIDIEINDELFTRQEIQLWRVEAPKDTIDQAP